MSRYYATLSRGEAVRAVAHAARPALLLAFAACFVAGVWLGRWSVLFETRARRRHLDAAVEKIVEGVLAGGGVKDAGASTAETRVAPIVEGVLAGLRDAPGGPRAANGTHPAGSASPERSTRPFDAAAAAAAAAAAERAELQRAAASLAAQAAHAAHAAAAFAREEQTPVEMDVDMEDAYVPPPEEEEEDEAAAAAASASASASAPVAPPTPPVETSAEFPAFSREEADSAADSSGPEPEPDPESAPEPPAPDPEPESPTRLRAREASEAQRSAETERQRLEARAAKKHAKSARLMTERVASHRRVIEESEQRASALDDARAEAQRDFERSGAHALASAGCLEATLATLGLYEFPPESPAAASHASAAKVESAYKRALAKCHPDRSAARGDDLAASARCEEVFKLLQAAHLRWIALGKPVGALAAAKAAVAVGIPHSRGSHAYRGRHTTAAAAAAAAARSGAETRSGDGDTATPPRRWRPNQSAGNNQPHGNNHHSFDASAAAKEASMRERERDEFRERAKRTAAAAADALRREEERVAAEAALDRERREAQERAARRTAERNVEAIKAAMAAEEAARTRSAAAAAMAAEATARARAENEAAARAAREAFHDAVGGRGAEFGEDSNNTAKEGGVGKTSPDAAFFERETRESARRQRKARRPPTRDASFEANMEKL